jgi:hypothetical protein
MTSALGRVFRIETEVYQRVMALAGFHNDIATAPAVSTRWTSARNELLPTKGHAAVPTVSGLHSNFGFIDEHARLSVHSYQFDLCRIQSHEAAIICFDVIELSVVAKNAKVPKRGPCLQDSELTDN